MRLDFQIAFSSMAISTNEERSLRLAQRDDSSKNDKGKERIEGAPAGKEPWILSRAWTKLGLDLGKLKMMVKGALAPTIALAIYQSTSVAKIYSTLGYLIAIMAVLSFAILPRSKFMQTMFLNIISICIGASIALLQIYCGVQARAHTTPALPSASQGPSPGAAVSSYNSSAAVVCAIWLFFNIYVGNALRASRPSLKFPVIVYNIFTSVASVYAPSFPNMSAGITFVERLLEAFMTGFAIASAVSLFVFPVTVRMIFFKQSAGFVQLLQAAFKAQVAYLHSMEKPDMFSPPHERIDNENNGNQHERSRQEASKVSESSETGNLKANIASLGALHGKMHADLAFAKREMAWGKLDASDVSQMLKLLRGVFLPLAGLGTAADIFQRVAAKYGWSEANTTSSNDRSSEEQLSQQIKSEWNEVMKTLRHPFETMTEAMNAGLQHSLYVLELAKMPKDQRRTDTDNTTGAGEDVEAEAGILKPGDAGYAKHLESQIQTFYDHRKATLAVYCQQRGIQLGANPFENMPEGSPEMYIDQNGTDAEARMRDRRRLYLVLYVSQDIVLGPFCFRDLFAGNFNSYALTSV